MDQHLTDPGDRATFAVSGGLIHVTLEADGTLTVDGVAEGRPRTHLDRLSMSPVSANSLRVSLARREDSQP